MLDLDVTSQWNMRIGKGNPLREAGGKDWYLAREFAELAGVTVRRIIEAIEMQNDSNWMMKYYSPEAQAKIAERAKTFTLEMQKDVSQAWKDYYRDLAALKDQEDPGGVKTAELAKRHRELVSAFTGNDPEVEAGLAAFYKDRANWPAEMMDLMKGYEG